MFPLLAAAGVAARPRMGLARPLGLEILGRRCPHRLRSRRDLNESHTRIGELILELGIVADLLRLKGHALPGITRPPAVAYQPPNSAM